MFGISDGYYRRRGLIIEMNMQLESKDLIIVNSTIISGILILLTISSFSHGEFPNRSIFVTLAVLSVIFFSILSLYVLSDNNKRPKCTFKLVLVLSFVL